MASRLLAATLLAAFGTTAIAANAADPSGDCADPDAAIRERIAALENAVRRDRVRLMELVTAPADPDAPPLRAHPDLREIAHRLPALQSEWKRLARSLSARDEPAAAR